MGVGGPGRRAGPRLVLPSAVLAYGNGKRAPRGSGPGWAALERPPELDLEAEPSGPSRAAERDASAEQSGNHQTGGAAR